MALTEREAYDAMLSFLYQYYTETHREEIYELLLEVRYSRLDKHGQPFTGDPRAWQDWLNAIGRSLAGETPTYEYVPYAPPGSITPD